MKSMLWSGVDFLREVNKEESKDMLSGHVVVIGGGNVARMWQEVL